MSDPTLPLSSRSFFATPRYVWILALGVVLLRVFPMLWGLAFHHVDYVFLPALFVPEDHLAYTAMIRQSGREGAFFLSNPYVTEPHDPRFILLFHNGLGLLQRLTGLSALLLLELSRIPLLFLFLTLWWRVVENVLSSPRARFWAMLLTAFGGGLDFIPWAAARWFSPQVAQEIYTNVSVYNGWSFFGQTSNPLWLAAWCLALPVLHTLLWPRGPQNIRAAFLVFCCQLMLCFVYPTTALWVYAVAVVYTVAARILRRPGPAFSILGALLFSSVIAALITRWQLQDAVFRESARELLGARNVWAWWYPFTLGAVGVLAWVGQARWRKVDHPWRLGILCWISVAAVLHQLPGINGYQFIPALFLPLTLLAAEPLAEAFSAWYATQRWKVLGLALLVFSSAPLNTLRSISNEELSRSVCTRESWFIVQWFQTEPLGRVIAGGEPALLIPAFTGHRVYAGHWFLTPHYTEKMARLQTWFDDPLKHLDELEALIQAEKIRYVMIPTPGAKLIMDHVRWKLVLGADDWSIFRIPDALDPLDLKM